MGEGRSDLQPADVGALDDVDKEVEISTLIRKPHIPIVKAQLLLLSSGSGKQEQNL